MNLTDRISRELNKRAQNNNLRKLQVKTGLIDFCSNDYLGLARSKELFDNIHSACAGYKFNGGTGSRLLTGNSTLAESTEKQLGGIFHSEAALIFNSGYTANLALFSTLPKRRDTIIYDELAHACIKEGARLSPAKRYSFKHNDLEDLENKVKKATGNIFIAIESVYSMDGDESPLEAMIMLAVKYQAHIIIDEAHTTGLSTKKDTRLSESPGLSAQPLLRTYTFGKAMGIHGAVVCGNKILIDYLINFARPFIYTTAPPPHFYIAIQEAFKIQKQALQLQLHKNINLFNNLFENRLKKQYHKLSSTHPIQSLLVPGNDHAKKASIYLENAGFDVRAILSPTVPKGKERLRICLHSFNTHQDIERLIDTLAAV